MPGSGGYHHRPDPPSMGNTYNEDGSLVRTHPWGKPTKKGSEPRAGKTTKRKRQGRRGRKHHMSRRPRAAKKPKPMRLHPSAGAGNAGTATPAYPAASQATGGAIPVREMDAISEVGLTPLLAELVNHGTVTLGHSLAAWQREQDRVTNRTWRRPGGLYRPAGL